jgi:hypothetical protein
MSSLKSRRAAKIAAPAPWSAEEDARLADMVRCGLASEFWKDSLPGRRFGEILERRLTLVEGGALQLARNLPGEAAGAGVGDPFVAAANSQPGRVDPLDWSTGPLAAATDAAAVRAARASDIILRIRDEEAGEAACPAFGDFADVGGQEVAKRALEIAVTGNHRLALVGGEDGIAAELRAAAIAIADQAGTDAEPFISMVAASNSGDDIEVQVGPRERRYPGAEGNAAVADRIYQARMILGEYAAKGLPEMDEPARRLFAQAGEAMQLDARRERQIVDVATTIAALAGSRTLGRVHIAEALSYVPRTGWRA